MRIVAGIDVLYEIAWFHQLPNVVKVSADLTLNGIGPNFLRSALRQASHHQAVMIRSRRFDRHALEKLVIEIGKLKPCDICRQSKR